MLKRRAGMVVMAVTLVAFWGSGCQKEEAVDPVKAVLFEKTEELFTRVKVKDYAVLYENEFPYLKEEASLEQYLAHPIIRMYSDDTLMAMEIDSVRVFEDTAHVFLKVEWLLADSSLKVDTIGMRWYYIDDEWINPKMSILEDQLTFEEELRVYWEAVREMQEREKSSGDTTGAGGDKE